MEMLIKHGGLLYPSILSFILQGSMIEQVYSGGGLYRIGGGRKDGEWNVAELAVRSAFVPVVHVYV